MITPSPLELASYADSIFVAQWDIKAESAVARIEYVATGSDQYGGLDTVVKDGRAQLRAQKSDNSGVNPQIVASDLGSFGTPVFNGLSQPGVGVVGNGVPGVTAFNVDIINTGGGNTGEFNSCEVGIWGGSPNGDTQNIITFFNATGPNSVNDPLGATPAGARLGEIAGCPSGPWGWFTETETWSINGYAAKAVTGSSAVDGEYTAPTNIVGRVAPNASAPERNTFIFDFNGNFFLGAGDGINGVQNYSSTPPQSDYCRNALWMTHSVADPTNNPPQYCGVLYCVAGYLKFKSYTGKVTILATP